MEQIQIQCNVDHDVSECLNAICRFDVCIINQVWKWIEMLGSIKSFVASMRLLVLEIFVLKQNNSDQAYPLFCCIHFILQFDLNWQIFSINSLTVSFVESTTILKTSKKMRKFSYFKFKFLTLCLHLLIYIFS